MGVLSLNLSCYYRFYFIIHDLYKTLGITWIRDVDLFDLYVHKLTDDKNDEVDADVLVKPKTRTKRPPLYKVLLLNDDYTPMEFVVVVLERFFGLNHAQAFEIMLTVHKKGVAVVGVFSHEIAETKVAQVMDYARRHQHPLQCTMEKE